MGVGSMGNGRPNEKNLDATTAPGSSANIGAVPHATPKSSPRHHPYFTLTKPTAHLAVTRLARAQGGNTHPTESGKGNGLWTCAESCSPPSLGPSITPFLITATIIIT
jgi:hypothetical protein